MLNYNDQYNISQGVFLAYKNNTNKRQFSVNHSDKVRSRFKHAFPGRYESFTRENFIFTCLYICFKRSPSSFEKFIDVLKEIDFNTDVLKFKNEILNYKHFIHKDVEYLASTYGKPTVDNIFKEFSHNKIQFYTLWFYLKYNNQLDYKFSHIQQLTINKIKVTLLYVTFSETSLDYIKNLMNESYLCSL